MEAEQTVEPAPAAPEGGATPAAEAPGPIPAPETAGAESSATATPQEAQEAQEQGAPEPAAGEGEGVADSEAAAAGDAPAPAEEGAAGEQPAVPAEQDQQETPGGDASADATGIADAGAAQGAAAPEASAAPVASEEHTPAASADAGPAPTDQVEGAGAGEHSEPVAVPAHAEPSQMEAGAQDAGQPPAEQVPAAATQEEAAPQGEQLTAAEAKQEEAAAGGEGAGAATDVDAATPAPQETESGAPASGSPASGQEPAAVEAQQGEAAAAAPEPAPAPEQEQEEATAAAPESQSAPDGSAATTGGQGQELPAPEPVQPAPAAEDAANTAAPAEAGSTSTPDGAAEGAAQGAVPAAPAETPAAADSAPAAAAAETAGSRPGSAAAAPPQVPPIPAGLAASGSMGHPRPPSSTRSHPSARGARSMAQHMPTYDIAQFVQARDLEKEHPMESAPTAHLLSLDARRRNNVAYVEDDVLVMAAGNNVVFLKLPNMTQSYLPGLDGGGVGAVAVHPSRRFLAVAEKCRHRSPNIYIYTYPTLSLVKVLKGGTERSYSALTFNDSGDQLASVGGWPDYLLTLWSWEEEAIVLRSKAFSQDVYTIKYSPYFQGNLTTSGTGHIRFWKMASTFTGLKLQGQIGKFGNIELSDIGAFVEMPDGKVLSGTETGELLMWDGGLIKVVLLRQGRRPCHEGQVDVLFHDRASNMIVSGGADGYVRLWDYHKVNDAEPDEDSNSLAIAPADEVLIAPGAHIRSLIWERRHWIILDAAGALYRVDLPQSGALSKGAMVTRLLAFHAGGIVGLTLSPSAHVAVTAGRDGSMRVFDYAARALVHTLLMSQPATAFTPVPGSASTLFVAGFQDGVVRGVMRVVEGLQLVAALKPHKGAVTAVAVSNDGRKLATTGEDGTVFFFNLNPPAGFEPICFTSLGGQVATCATWSDDGTRVLLGTRTGAVIELSAPEPGSVDTHHTYEAELPRRQQDFKLPLPKKLVRKSRAVAANTNDGAEEVSGSDLSSQVAAAEEGEAGAAAAEGDGAARGSGTGDSAADAPAAAAAAGGLEGAGESGTASTGTAATTTTTATTTKREEPKVEMIEIIDEEAAAALEDEVLEVLTLQYVPGSTTEYYISVTGRGAGSVWRQSLEAEPGTEPLAAIPAPSTGSASFFSFGRNGTYHLIGTTDGVVRVQPLAPGTLPYSPQPGAGARYWQAALHDMQGGRVSGVALSFDEAFCLSACRDGTLYLQEMKLDPSKPYQPKPSGQESLLHSADAPPPVMDITNPNDYTLEEAKQKAEQDALVAAAEAKKMGVRDYLKQIRAEFETLLAENAAKPEAERLPRSAFEIDVGLREMVQAETARREEAARKELAWETEKRRLALTKLRAYFLDQIEVERIVLHAIRSKSYVTTFRTRRMSPEMLAELEQVKQAEAARNALIAARGSTSLLQGTGSSGGAPAVNAAGRRSSSGAQGGLQSTPSLGGVNTQQGTAATEDTSRMTKADLRRLARKKREAEWQAFMQTRPNDTYEDPADVAAIREAQLNMGDFKLKSDPNYVIPEEERMTPQRKHAQMLLLEEAMHDAQMNYNHRFLALREVKRKVIAEINTRVAQLVEIAAQLGKLGDLTVPGSTASGDAKQEASLALLALQPDEVPEDREKVTDEDIEEYITRKAEEERKHAQGGALGGFATGGGGGNAGAAAAGKGAAGARGAAGSKAAGGAKGSTAAAGAGAGTSPDGGAVQGGGAGSTEDALSRMMAAVPLSELERQLQALQRKRLEHLRTRLLSEIEELASGFDEALGALRKEKFSLEADLKMCEIRQLVHAQELALLRDFDKREVVLIQKRAAKQDDRNEILDKISDCNAKLEVKRSELEGLLARRAAVISEFDAAVPESDPFREQLSKIFHRKIKRSKKKLGAGGDKEDEESEEEEEEGGDDEEGDDDEDDDGGEEVCPPGCDHGLYERVCDLREKRLDEEELVTDFTKTIDVLKKEKEALAKKQKLVEQGLGVINQDITEFQKEKQGALNQIDVVVNLKMHQIEYLVDGRLPEDMSAALVFSAHELERLKRRIEELDDEKAELKARHKGLKKEHLQLLKDKASKEAKVKELEARAHDVQMLKFGQVIDLELLDALGASRGTEELKEELRRQEAAYAKELAEWDQKVAARMDELMALTRENTEALNAVSSLTVSQRGLEAGLTATRKTMFADPVLQRRQEVEERDGLVQLVNAQAKELDRLKAQVLALRRKDTSVYS